MNKQQLTELFFEKDILPWLRTERKRSYWAPLLAHQLSAGVDAGVDLPEALDWCSKEISPRPLKRILRQVKAAIEQGWSLSEALKRHAPKVFPPSFYGVLEIGEKSGTLAECLKLWERNYSAISTMRRMVIGATIYPLMIMLIGAAVFVFILKGVIPIHQEIISDLELKSPIPLKILFSLSSFLRTHGSTLAYGAIIAVILLFAFFRAARRSAFFRGIVLRVPFVGRLMQRSNVMYFSTLMNMLLSAGATVHEALMLCEDEAMAPAFRRTVSTMAQSVSAGLPFSEAVRAEPVFTPTFLWLVATGESRGDLTDSLGVAAEFERTEVQAAAGRIAQLLEPILILAGGVGIGFIVVSTGFPLFRMLYYAMFPEAFP